MSQVPEQVGRLPRRELCTIQASEIKTLATDCETMLVEILGVSSPDLVSTITHSYIEPGWRCANDNAELLPFVGPYAFIDRPGVYEFVIEAAFSPALGSVAVFDLAVTRGVSREQFDFMLQTAPHDVKYYSKVIPALTEVVIDTAIHPQFPRFRELLIQNQGDAVLSVRIAEENPSGTAEFFVGVAAAANFRLFDSLLLGRSTFTLFANDTLGNTDVMVGLSLW